MELKSKISSRAVIALIAIFTLFTFANIDSLASSKKSGKAKVSLSQKSKSSKSSKKSKSTKVSSKKGGKKAKKGKLAKSEVRHYNPTQTRAQAMETLRGSDELAALAGIESTDEDIQKLSLLANADNDDASIAVNSASEQNSTIIGDEGEDITELEKEDNVIIDIDQMHSLWLAYVSDENGVAYTAGGFKRKDIMDNIMSWLGTPYHFGGSAENGIDCSAFVRMIYGNVSGEMLPRTAASQFMVGKVIKRDNLQYGDLVFFHTRKGVYVGHVGIYLGDNLFAHASSRFGVTVSSLESEFYAARFLGGRRLNKEEMTKYSSVENRNNSSKD